jgi:SOS response regulatory protein OraA/RecX
MTWKPDPTMTEKQIQKELNRQAVMFEEACANGQTTTVMKFQEFAEQWIESRMKKYGPARIRQELKIKGVDAETADASMLACSEESQLEAAVSVARKKIRSASSAADLPKLFRQVTGMLVRRGFSWETAKKAYDIAIQEPEE